MGIVIGQLEKNLWNHLWSKVYKKFNSSIQQKKHFNKNPKFLTYIYCILKIWLINAKKFDMFFFICEVNLSFIEKKKQITGNAFFTCNLNQVMTWTFWSDRIESFLHNEAKFSPISEMIKTTISHIRCFCMIIIQISQSQSMIRLYIEFLIKTFLL